MANDPTWSNVTTLINFDPFTGDIEDESVENAEWSINFDCLKTTGEVKFGDQSLRINAGGELTYPSLGGVLPP